MNETSQNTLRLVVSGHISPRCMAIDVDPDFGTQDEWSATMENVVDSLPEMQDFADAATLGELDATEGIYNPPHWSRTADYDAYIIAWNNHWALANKRILSR